MAIKEYKLMGIKISQNKNWWNIISFNVINHAEGVN